MKPHDSKSFTLTEVLIAVLIIAITTVVFISSFVATFGYLKRVVELRNASLILQEGISSIREMRFQDIQSMGSSFSLPAMSDLRNAQGIITKTPYNGHNDIIKITLQLNWTAFDEKAATKTIVTLITNHGINKK